MGRLMVGITGAMRPCSGTRPIAEVGDWPLVQLHARMLGLLSFEPCRSCRRDALSGQSLWVATTEWECRVGLAFSWSAIAPGAIALADMTDIATNALLSDDSGVVSPSLHRAYCARVLHQLPWQLEILRSLKSWQP
ncbi:hypothetical protein RA210_U10516 [Rubrivivax sp. A210]|uniref:hypothetical protein n=1 Tax=Rubrivivax sp. A210 TaxID=2772301 RepID=UPI001919C9F4|nr:hypothetical protein [Rubrivivax sp. A210]CAD5366819.1 hypothetical protein RA210_U10516 [Rubrivivax sp. A210]